jgi:hypothetical protein
MKAMLACHTEQQGHSRCIVAGNVHIVNITSIIQCHADTVIVRNASTEPHQIG